MDRLKQIFLFFLALFLFACADTSPPPLTMGQFLYTQTSMTKQLESLDNNLTVRVLYSGMEDSRNFKRVVSLSLKNKPVIIGVSQANIGSPYFVDLLKNSAAKPIGKILFAKDSEVKRDRNMQVEEVNLGYISDKLTKM
jgi:chorismate-pyruvate lyase